MRHVIESFFSLHMACAIFPTVVFKLHGERGRFCGYSIYNFLGTAVRDFFNRTGRIISVFCFYIEQSHTMKILTRSHMNHNS